MIRPQGSGAGEHKNEPVGPPNHTPSTLVTLFVHITVSVHSQAVGCACYGTPHLGYVSPLPRGRCNQFHDCGPAHVHHFDARRLRSVHHVHDGGALACSHAVLPEPATGRALVGRRRDARVGHTVIGRIAGAASGGEGFRRCPLDCQSLASSAVTPRRRSRTASSSPVSSTADDPPRVVPTMSSWTNPSPSRRRLVRPVLQWWF